MIEPVSMGLAGGGFSLGVSVGLLLAWGVVVLGGWGRRK